MQDQKKLHLKTIVLATMAELNLESSHLFHLEREFKAVHPETNEERIVFFVIASASNILAKKIDLSVDTNAEIENYQYFFSSIIAAIDSLASAQVETKLSEIIEMVSKRPIIN
jgi:hypothetical protein